MGQGGNQTQRVDVIDSIDPRTDGRAAQKGTLYRYIPASGNPTLLIKADDGFSTNWISLSSGASAPVTPVTAASTADVDLTSAPATIDGVAYTTVLLKDQSDNTENGVYDYNGTGSALTRNSEWDTAGEFSVGRQVFVEDGDTEADTLWINTLAVTTLGSDPIVFIEITAGSFMLTDFSNMVPQLENGLAYYDSDGILTSNNHARFDESANSLAFGSETGGGVLDSTGTGSISIGRAASGNIEASGVGSFSAGQVSGGTSIISASAAGTFAKGVVSGGGQILAAGPGSTAFGIAATDFLLNASGDSSFCAGQAILGTSETSGQTSFSWGDSHTVSADFAVAFGIGHFVSSYQCFVIGQYAASTGTPSAYVSTDPAFVIGNGTGIGGEANAFRVDKGGKITTTAAQKSAIKLVSGPYTLSAATDYTVIGDGSTAGGPHDLQLPAGEDGLEFRFAVSFQAPFSNYTLVVDGADTFDGGLDPLISAGSTRTIQFLGGVWYAIASNV